MWLRLLCTWSWVQFPAQRSLLQRRWEAKTSVFVQFQLSLKIPRWCEEVLKTWVMSHNYNCKLRLYEQLASEAINLCNVQCTSSDLGSSYLLQQLHMSLPYILPSMCWRIKHQKHGPSVCIVHIFFRENRVIIIRFIVQCALTVHSCKWDQQISK